MLALFATMAFGQTTKGLRVILVDEKLQFTVM
jgi:hypothetical protein